MHEIPATKIESFELNKIGGQSSDMEDSDSAEEAPSRSKELKVLQSSQSEIKKEE